MFAYMYSSKNTASLLSEFYYKRFVKE